MNSRHERNLLNINVLNNKIEELRQVIQLTEDEEVKINLALEIQDYENEIMRLQMSFKELLAETKEDLLKLYLNDEEGDWSVAWSGGKDSTTVAGLVTDMLLELPEVQRKRNVHFVMSDTLVENPNLESYMHRQVEKLKEFADKSKLPITVNLAQRPIEQSYFYLILGRGVLLTAK